MSKWNDHVNKTWKQLKKKNPKTPYKTALKEASKTYKNVKENPRQKRSKSISKQNNTPEDLSNFQNYYLKEFQNTHITPHQTSELKCTEMNQALVRYVGLLQRPRCAYVVGDRHSDSCKFCNVQRLTDYHHHYYPEL